jgi:hypothetical protein
MKNLNLICFIGLIIGCGSGGPKLNFVEGVVTVEGKPIANASVTFSPVSGSGLSSVGSTDGSGKYVLMSAGGDGGVGAVEGVYEVAVSKTDLPASSSGSNQGSSDEPPARIAVMPKAEIPAEYSNPKTSGLRATVIAGKNTDVNFDLKKTFKK